MKKVFLVAVVVAGVGAGCGETFGMDGGTPVTTTWAISDQVSVSDECEVNDPPIDGTFDITVDGSTVTIDHTTIANLAGTDDEYVVGDEMVFPVGVTTNNEVPPCVVERVERFTLTLDDAAGGFEGSDTIEARWEHNDEDISDPPDTCEDLWFHNNLDPDCQSVLTFTLTKT